MSEILIGIGTNMGDRMKNINEAAMALTALPQTKILRAAGVYETAPVGYEEQADFYNTVLLLETELSPHTILGACLGIEAAMGRKRTMRDGPRVIDLDLLMYGSVKMDTHDLTLPHPRMMRRAFVLEPLMELYPAGWAMGTGFSHKLRDIKDQAVRRTAEQVKFE